MSNASHTPKAKLSMSQLFRMFLRILGPERNFYILAIIYGVGISLLSLATPISVQMLINTVANTGLAMPLIVLSASLFGLLFFSGMLNALRVHLMEIFARRFYARMVAEITLRSIYAQNPFFNDASRGALLNRYFDIVGVQKAIPVLFIGGFTVILQAGVGFVLVSLYHPLFLVFNLVLIGLIWLTWLVLGRSAIRSAIGLSHAKHNTAAWLETLGASDGFFKSAQRVNFALDKTDEYTQSYIKEHSKHFRRHFAQTLSFLILYAAASAALLGLGGWLVIQGQLTLGQLVAAELVLSAAFFGVSQLGIYLNYFYDLCAAVEELHMFYEVEQEEPSGDDPILGRDHKLVFNKKYGKARHGKACLDLTIEGGATVMAVAKDHGIQRLFTNLLKRHTHGDSGVVSLGGIDLLDLNVQSLRRNIYVMDRATFIGATIREYLKLSAKPEQANQMIEVLETVGLSGVVASLPKGLDTEIAPTGWPLSTAEVMQLKLANAIISQPKVLVLNQLFDLIEENYLERAITELRDKSDTTVIYFSNRQVDIGFDTYINFEAEAQTFFKDHDSFCQSVHGRQANVSAAMSGLTAQQKPSLEKE